MLDAHKCLPRFYRSDRCTIRFGSLFRSAVTPACVTRVSPKSSPGLNSDPFDTVLVIRGQQQHLIARVAENYVEVVEHVTAEDAQVGRRRVGEGRELAA